MRGCVLAMGYGGLRGYAVYRLLCTLSEYTVQESTGERCLA